MVGFGSPRELHGAVARLLDAVRAWAFNEDAFAPADAAPMALEADLVLDGQEIVVAPALDFFGYVVSVHLVPFRPRTRAVLEDVAIFKVRLRDEIACLLKRLLRFAAEANDEIAANSDAGHDLAAASQHVAIELDTVEPLHPPK